MHQPPVPPQPEPTSGSERPPRHGFQGDRGAAARPDHPAALTIAVSRESGARGATIARRVGRKLGWQVYDQELLEYLAQEAVARQGVIDNLQGAATAWAETRLEELVREHDWRAQRPLIVNLARVVLALGAQGEAVLIGRGAGCILPRATTLHVRIVAPLPERIAYLSQWLRLTVEEAADRVRLRDERRAEFLASHFHRDPGDVHQYDLVLNSSLLGEEVCAELIAHAARTRSVPLAGAPRNEPLP
jgi:cytidylate kinase